MWLGLEKANRGVGADILRFIGVFSWKRHRVHRELTETKKIIKF